MIDGVVLDLDDTIYLERDYVRSGFQHLAAHLADRSERDAPDIFTFLGGAFETGVRGNSFDLLLAEFPDLGETISVAEMVQIYRLHLPDIDVEDRESIDRLSDNYAALGLITDGAAASQRLKLQALGLEGLFHPAVLTDEWGVEFRKPHHRAFAHVESTLGLPGERLAYVGDNPAKDFIAPNERGWFSVRLRAEGQLHVRTEATTPIALPAHEISAMSELLAVLSSS